MKRKKHVQQPNDTLNKIESRIVKRLAERAAKYHREFDADKLEVYESQNDHITSGKHDRTASTVYVRPNPKKKGGSIRDFDKDPFDKDPFDKDPPFSRDNFSRDNFSRNA